MSEGPSTGDRVRKRILISAYACAPGLDEPEAGAGWAFGRAAAADHDVWLFTRNRFEPAISAAIAQEPELARHLTVVYLDLPRRVLALRKRPGSVYWYYALWQREVGRSATALHAELEFDVIHHLTFAVDWQPCGLAALAKDVPLVWGPVGGATYLPWRLIPAVGARNVLSEALRTVVTKAARRVWGDPVARRSAIVIAQNYDDADRFSYARRVVVECNSAFTDLPARTRPAGEGRRAIFVGRLIPWKGAALAVAALAEPPAKDWTLEIYGAGRELGRLQAQVRKLGLSGRVTFKGHQPRASILAAMVEADAMLFPSMHDSAPWAVGEASSTGLPVVCLGVGGPPVLAAENGFVVDYHGKNVRAVTRELAVKLAEAGQRGGRTHARWSADRLSGLLTQWYSDAASSRS